MENNTQKNKNKFHDMFNKIKNPENIVNKITANINMLVNSKKLSSSNINNFYKNISDKNINNFYKNLSDKNVNNFYKNSSFLTTKTDFYKNSLNSNNSNFYKNISDINKNNFYKEILNSNKNNFYKNVLDSYKNTLYKNNITNYPFLFKSKENNEIKEKLLLNNLLDIPKNNDIINTDINNIYRDFSYPEKTELYKEDFNSLDNSNKTYKNSYSIFSSNNLLKNIYSKKQHNYSIPNLRKFIQDKINLKKFRNNNLKKDILTANNPATIIKSFLKKDNLKITNISKTPEKLNFLNEISNIQKISNLSKSEKESKFKTNQEKRIYEEKDNYKTIKLNENFSGLKGNINISPNINVELKPQNMVNDFSKIWAEIGERLNSELNASAEGIHF